MEPLVYIILVNYNGANDTIECVNSLERIKYSNYKIIIIDNASTDNSVEILQKNINSRHKIIKSSDNNGFSAGNNIGINIAIKEKAEYVLLLNNDTLVDERFLNELIDCTKENTGISIGKIYYTKEKNKIWYDGGSINFVTGKITHNNYNEYDKHKNSEINEVTFATGCCMLIPINVIKTVGFLKEDYFLYYEDSDYCANVIKAGYEIRYNPKAIIYHSVSSSTGNNSKLSQYYMIRNRAIFIKRNLDYKKRYVAWLYFICQLIKLLITREISLSSIFKALNDYFKGIVGKSDRKF